ncbi:MAG: hypothetical protein QUS35_13275, partial [bacterium]|nr:hypothetical protein [bacterium]
MMRSFRSTIFSFSNTNPLDSGTRATADRIRPRKPSTSVFRLGETSHWASREAEPVSYTHLTLPT